MGGAERTAEAWRVSSVCVCVCTRWANVEAAWVQEGAAGGAHRKVKWKSRGGEKAGCACRCMVGQEQGQEVSVGLSRWLGRFSG